MLPSAEPMDDNSVSSLVALDSAVEAVAARVTPAVVNVAVTSRGSMHETGGEQDQEGGQDGQGQMQGTASGILAVLWTAWDAEAAAATDRAWASAVESSSRQMDIS